MYNFKPLQENRRKIRKNQKELDVVERAVGIVPGPVKGKKIRAGEALPEGIKSLDAKVEYEMDGTVAKMKVEE